MKGHEFYPGSGRGAVRPAGLRSWRRIAMHHGARRGGLQARRERRGSLQVPTV
jgi:hypothetical protein